MVSVEKCASRSDLVLTNIQHLFMKITSIRTYVLDAPLSENFGFSQWEFSRRSTMLVEIATDAGIEGWGEAYGPVSFRIGCRVSTRIAAACPLSVAADLQGPRG